MAAIVASDPRMNVRSIAMSSIMGSPAGGRLLAEALAGGLSEVLDRAGLPHTVNRSASLFSLFFGEGPVRNYEEARRADHSAYAAFFGAMLERGVYLPPSGYEGWFVGTAHGETETERTVEAAREAAGAAARVLSERS